MDDSARNELIFNAQLAEKAERYDEMVSYMKALGKVKADFDLEERNLLSVAYKNSVVGRRTSWRILQQLERRQRDKGNESGANVAKEYRVTVEGELRRICEDALQVLQKCFASADGVEAKVFYSKMKGDYYRYMAEFEAGSAQQLAATKAKEAYEEGKSLAQGLAPMHPIRLGLALNDAVFHYEILEDTDRACSLAQDSFDAAVGELESLKDENYRDSTLIMQMLKDNLALWKAAGQKDSGA
eukprot:Polyplicarium_translucidae@DN1426_c0_g1_i1.p1